MKDSITTNRDLIQEAISSLAWLTPNRHDEDYQRGIRALEELKRRLK